MYYSKNGPLRLCDLVQSCHKALADASGWTYSPIKPYTFGYDNLGCSVGRAMLSLCPPTYSSSERVTPSQIITPSAEELAVHIHNGWCENYVWWCDKEPWKPKDSPYKTPYTPLGDARRNECAATSFVDLPSEEKEKDRVIARHLLSLFE